MIVFGADMHKSSHTIAGIAAMTGEMRGERTVSVGVRGFEQVLQWARGLGRDRVWALEDCRHVSGSFERFLIARGERVVRVPTRLMATSRRSSRERGKSDRIDALAVARAALAAGLETLPTAELAGPELDIRLLVDHRERLVRARVALNNEAAMAPARPLARARTARQLPVLRQVEHPHRAAPRARRADDARPHRPRRAAPAARADPAINALEAEIADLVGQVAPQLLDQPGFGPLTAAKLVGEIAGAARFATDAKLARAAGLAPIPVSSGRTDRHRLDRGGNRQINAAIHRVAVTRARCHPETIDFISRKKTEGNTHREAIRSLKRHLARRIWQLLRTPQPGPETTPHPSIS
jgi:transposase